MTMGRQKLGLAFGIAFLALASMGCLELSPLDPAVVRVVPSHEVAVGPSTQAVQRPLSDFLDAQGSTNIFVPPVPDYVGWASAAARPPVRFASVDYAGLAASWLEDNGGPSLATTVSGTVTERPLQDGRAEVHVTLKTTRALTWAFELPGDVATAPLIMGYRAQDLAANPTLIPALSNSEFQVVFINTAPGDPLPDLISFILGTQAPGQELIKLIFRSQGSGPLRAPFGVPEGTAGRINVVQTGIFMTSFHGATADGFPAEKVELRVVGGGHF